MSMARPDSQAPLHFTFDRRPLDAHERRPFNDDLASLGFDDRLLQVLNGLVSTGTRDDIPHVLRGMRDGQLVFAAHPIVCRRMMRTFFPNRVGALLDLLPVPTVHWTRHDPGVDLSGSPGFVARGEDRPTAVSAAIAFLTRRFVSVSLLEDAAEHRPGACVEVAMTDTGRHDVATGAIDALFGTHAHLRRKVAKFRNKGGTIDCIEGPLTEADRVAVLRCIRHAQEAGMLRLPFQGNYIHMVDWATRADVPGLVHLVARLDGEPVGYHAFLESGAGVTCLSGGFDRTRGSTYHAYENVLLEAMRRAEARGATRVCFGPVTNPSKAALMTGSRPLVARIYSRMPPMRWLVDAIVPWSAMRPAMMAPFRTHVTDAPSVRDPSAAESR